MYKYKINGKFGRNEYVYFHEVYDAGIRAANRVNTRVFYIYEDGKLTTKGEYLKTDKYRSEWIGTPIGSYKNPVSPKQALKNANSSTIANAKEDKADEVYFAKEYHNTIKELNIAIKIKQSEVKKWERIGYLVKEGKYSEAEKVAESMIGNMNQATPSDARNMISDIKRFSTYRKHPGLVRDIKTVDMYRNHPSIKKRK